jgi:hypothetical protein
MRQFSEYIQRQVEGITSIDDSGSISGIANRLGDLDSFATIADPQSITPEMIERWVKRGAFLGCHEHDETAIGYLESAQIESIRDLTFTARYHSTSRAQEFRTVAAERLAADRTVGFSIGFRVSNYEYFPSGKKFLEIMAQRGRESSLFNIEQISAHDDELWLMQLSEILEVSQVNFASNQASEASMIRAAELGDEEAPEPTDEEKQAAADARAAEISAKFERHDQHLQRKVQAKKVRRMK